MTKYKGKHFTPTHFNIINKIPSQGTYETPDENSTNISKQIEDSTKDSKDLPKKEPWRSRKTATKEYWYKHQTTIFIAIIILILGSISPFIFINKGEINGMNNFLNDLTIDIDSVYERQINNIEDINKSINELNINSLEKLNDIENKINILEIELKKDLEFLKDKISELK